MATLTSHLHAFFCNVAIIVDEKIRTRKPPKDYLRSRSEPLPCITQTFHVKYHPRGIFNASLKDLFHSNCTFGSNEGNANGSLTLVITNKTTNKRLNISTSITYSSQEADLEACLTYFVRLHYTWLPDNWSHTTSTIWHRIMMDIAEFYFHQIQLYDTFPRNSTSNFILLQFIFPNFFTLPRVSAWSPQRRHNF